MIICITENCHHWDNWGEPYLIDTSKLTNEYLRAYLESYQDKIINVTSENSLFINNFNNTDIFQAIVEPPQMVDKLLSIVFE